MVKVSLKIPKAFEDHFKADRFSESIARIAYDISLYKDEPRMSGNYEHELMEMLGTAFHNAEIQKENIIVFDLETTGFKAPDDEVLQISMAKINSDGTLTTLMNTYVRPEHNSSWEQAMKINNITPEMVKDAPTLSELAQKIEEYFNEADLVVSYNGRKNNMGEPWAGFDRPFLEKSGINTGNAPDYDVMVEFKNKTKMPCYSKLVYTSQMIGYDFTEKAHDSMEDVKATAKCYDFLSSGKSIGQGKIIGLVLDYKRDEYGNIRLDRNGNKVFGYNGEFKILNDSQMYSFADEHNTSPVMFLDNKLGFKGQIIGRDAALEDPTRNGR